MLDAEGTVVDLPLGPSLVERLRELSAQPMEYRAALNAAAAAIEALEQRFEELEQGNAELEWIVSDLLRDGSHDDEVE